MQIFNEIFWRVNFHRKLHRKSQMCCSIDNNRETKPAIIITFRNVARASSQNRMLKGSFIKRKTFCVGPPTQTSTFAVCTHGGQYNYAI